MLAGRPPSCSGTCTLPRGTLSWSGTTQPSERRACRGGGRVDGREGSRAVYEGAERKRAAGVRLQHAYHTFPSALSSPLSVGPHPHPLLSHPPCLQLWHQHQKSSKDIASLRLPGGCRSKVVEEEEDTGAGAAAAPADGAPPGLLLLAVPAAFCSAVDGAPAKVVRPSCALGAKEAKLDEKLCCC